MKTAEICEQLVHSFGCLLLSAVTAAPPSDIDIYTPPEKLETIRELLIREGYVQTSRAKGQDVFRRFEDEGKLYILDLMSSFDAYAACTPALELSPQGHRKIGQSASLHRSFKALCLGQKNRIEHLVAHRHEIADFLCEERNFLYLNPEVRRAAYGEVEDLFRAMAHAPLSRYLKHRLVRIRARLARIGTGKSVAFLGPDGSGKTFIVDRLLSIGDTRMVYMGDWFFRFQPLYHRLLVTIPSPWNRFIHLFYILENVPRRLRVAFHRLSGRLVLIDRFPGANRAVIHGGFLGRLNRLTFSLFPKPDLFILLDAPPEIIRKRKQELPVEEIAMVQHALRKLLTGERHLIVNTCDLDACLNRLLAELTT